MTKEYLHSAKEQERSLIVNGNDASLGRFPYFVTLDRFCAGALIAPDIVLTAGHCKPATLTSVGQVHVGTYYMDYQADAELADTGGDHETFGLIDMQRHADWIRRGDDEFVHDFTLLTLNGQSQHTPVRINRNTHVPAPHQAVTAMGLGDLTEYADVRPDLLQQVDLTYLPNEQCRLADNGAGESYHEPADRIGPTHLCTVAPPHNDKDACSYDSGGPIVVTNDDDGNHNAADDDVLVALVSWGIGCADPIFPGVNARVSAVSDWIDAYVCAHSAHPPNDFKCVSTTRPSSHLGHDTWWMACGIVLLVGVLYKLMQRRGGFFCQAKKFYQVLDDDGGYSSDDSLDNRFVKGMERHNTGETANVYSEDDDEKSEHDNEGSSPLSYQAMQIRV